jgi:hypothetical protein
MLASEASRANGASEAPVGFGCVRAAMTAFLAVFLAFFAGSRTQVEPFGTPAGSFGAQLGMPPGGWVIPRGRTSINTSTLAIDSGSDQRRKPLRVGTLDGVGPA